MSDSPPQVAETATSALYRRPEHLRSVLRDVLGFYHPTCLDTQYGGYVAQLDERDGTVYDGTSKHLVATTRAIHNFSLGWHRDGPMWCRPAAEHGLDFLERGHYDETHGGYDWVLDGRDTVEATRYCYGHAFVLLAYARAHQAGLADAEDVHRVARLLESRFLDGDTGLFAAEATADWSTIDDYRGQNANMHGCEAHIAAYEATGTQAYLERALTIAEMMTRRLPEHEDGLVWEHYTEDWEPDFEYNREQPRHTFRPWGYQPGHQVEWAKLCCLLARHVDAEWLPARAMELFDAAIRHGWDDEHGGFYYTVDEGGDPVVDDKYGWVVAEAIGAAALLGVHDEAYWEWYDALWAHAQTHLVNPRTGNWYARLTRNHTRDAPNHGIAVEPGYHPIANVDIALSVFGSDAD